jgi:hypothetical protein
LRCHGAVLIYSAITTNSIHWTCRQDRFGSISAMRLDSCRLLLISLRALSGQDGCIEFQVSVAPFGIFVHDCLLDPLFQYTRTIRNCGSLLQVASVSVFVQPVHQSIGGSGRCLYACCSECIL